MEATDEGDVSDEEEEDDDDVDDGLTVANTRNYDMKTLDWQAPRGPGNNSYAYDQTVACRVIRATDGYWAELPRRAIPLEAAQTIVGGDIQVFKVLYDTKHTDRILIVAESGRELGMPINARASACMYRGVVGNAILCESRFLE